ncbi:MAG: UDP-N-acetylmuramoyl-L-alanyl-D-glutamate--2,6-diaminopimelate ligase, partial [Alphaproteobacteria bacterium]|nr:UDP-N-acetylmuramoyl-L-alanyl-D-glutamate--2,6-diaminopimelate ligase [Alphaproteobacteria bacterium]
PTRLADYDPSVTSLTADSRQVTPGAVFAALPGTHHHGADFVADALAKGAMALILGTDGIYEITVKHAQTGKVPLFVTENPALVLAKVAARFYGRQPQNIVAVTGTNGKTSVSWFCQAIWQKLGLSAGVIGTIGVFADQQLLANSLTTPSSVDLHRFLAQMSAKGVAYVAIEASSHGLEQYRLDGARLRAAGFTNLSRDHLDYHGTMAAYLKAKSTLFSRILPQDGIAVLNSDVPEFAALNELAQKRGQTVFQYGKNAEELRLLSQNAHEDGQELRIAVFGTEYQVNLPLIGEFQAMNALCALGLVLAVGADQNRAVAALSHLPVPPGRAQVIGRGRKGGIILIDYAHTPDALERILTSLRPLAQNRLLVGFGCGGNRDRGKRPLMGEIAARIADYVVVTDDNPRQEEAAVIRQAILKAAQGVTPCKATVLEMGDRTQAIAHLVSELQEGDIAVLAGKGHEVGQIIGDKTLPFDDAEMVKAALRDQGGTLANERTGSKAKTSKKAGRGADE